MLWSGSAFAQRSSSAGQSNLIAMLVAALITQVVASMTDPAHDLSRFANGAMVFDRNRGFLRGPFHPHFAEDQRGR